MSSLAAPFHCRPFPRLILAYTVNSMGTWLGQVALALLVLRATHSPAAVAAVWTMSYFGPALLSPLITLRLERVQSHVVLPCLFVIEGALFAVLALAAESFSL